jgi:hypothetical protein
MPMMAAYLCLRFLSASGRLVCAAGWRKVFLEIVPILRICVARPRRRRPNGGGGGGYVFRSPALLFQQCRVVAYSDALIIK